MLRKIYRANQVGNIIFTIIFSLALLVVLIGSGKVWMYVFLAVPLLIFIMHMKMRLIIEGNMLYFEKLFQMEEIDLMEVAQFQVNSVKLSTKEPRLVHVIDKEEVSRFSFPIGYIEGNNRRHFEEQVLSVNGNIKFTVARISSQLGRG